MHMHSALLATLTLWATAQGTNLTLNPPALPPSSSSDRIDHSFPGFAIDALALPQFIGNDTLPGTFSYNLIETIANRTGAPAHMRCGGTKFDHTAFNSNLSRPSRQIHPLSSGKDIDYEVGPRYFKPFKNWPGLQWTYQVPMPFGTLENALHLLEHFLMAVPKENLYALEIGNEPNIGKQTLADVKNYVNEWLNYSKTITANLSLPSERIFQGLSFSSNTSELWNVKTLFENGINQYNNIKTVSHHFYEVYLDDHFVTAPQYMQSTLLNHSHLISRTTNLTSANTFLKKNHPDIGLVLGEIDSGYPKNSPGNKTDFDNILKSLGTAVWTVDFHMYMMSQGVKAVSNQLGIHWDFSPWIANATFPNNSAVHAQYYGIVFIADAIGSDKSIDIRTYELNNTDYSAPAANVTAYAFYHGDDLAKMVILNLDFWIPSNGGKTRPYKDVEIAVPKSANSSGVKVERLAGADSFDQNTVTWAGERWTHANMGVAEKVKNDTQILQVQEGRITVRINATEAVLVTF